MSQEQREMVHRLLRDAPFDLGGDPAVQRPLLEAMLTAQPLPDDVRLNDGDLGGVPVVFINVADGEPRGVIVHLHGGGFAMGSARGSAGLVSMLARKTGMMAVAIDYRLSPEQPYPAALHDATAAYQALLEQFGDTAPIVVSGESAGGNFAIELLISGLANRLSMPAAAVLFSPVTDLTVGGSSYHTNSDRDPNITAAAIRTRAADYLGKTGTAANDPLVSPIFADLTGLPPLLIQAGSHEVLLDDAITFAARAAAHDVAVTLDITPGVPHVFQGFAAILDEGEQALTRAADFLQAHTAQGVAGAHSQSRPDSAGVGQSLRAASTAAV
jgi:acetyl esterase/lipase